MDCLPTELVDMIIDFLHDDSKALMQCCLTSKSFIDPTRTHLFKRVYFKEPDDLQAWKKCFPVPERSPSTFTKDLRFDCAERVEDEVFTEWIRRFTNVVRLEVLVTRVYKSQDVFAPFHNLFPHVKSLSMSTAGREPQQVFDFICSFPLLEDLHVVRAGHLCGTYNSSSWHRPKLTGTLVLGPGGGGFIGPLLELPGGPRFREIVFDNPDLDRGFKKLVERCSDTLECIDIKYYRKHSKSYPLTPLQRPAG